MPSLDEALPLMEAELTRRLGVTSITSREPDFAIFLEIALGELIDSGKAGAAVAALAEAGLDQSEALAEAEPDETREAIALAGLKLNPKIPAILKKLARWLTERHHGDFAELAEASAESIREELRQINGIGAATADVLLLRALGRPAFPVDRAAYRIFLRHGWLELNADYDEARSALERLAPDDAAALEQWTRWLDKIGKDFCKPSAAKCERCPLQEWLPESGPVDPL